MKPVALVALAALLAAPAFAAPRASARPRAASFYDRSDPDAARKQRIDDIMGIYEVHAPRRHPSEQTRIKGRALQIDIWHPIGRNTDAELKTRAVQWFVFGRTQYASGVRGIFSEFPDITDVRLAFHEVIRPDEKGRRKSTEPDQIKRYLLLHIDRARFERLKMEALEGCVERGDCSRAFRSAFKEARFDKAYTAKAREEY
ncbi:MAG: hypothetical protein KC620_14120 [Myxococcales bacterium]|nr:hypothetical protein [Myxococcales bacterium]